MPRRNPELAHLEKQWGIAVIAQDYMPDGFRNDFRGALDAQPALVTTANGGVPVWLTNYVDPEVIRILQAPNEGSEILGEKKTGSWTTRTAVFPVIENTGEVASYGDASTNGKSSANANWPQRQSYHFQTVVEYGDKEVELAGEAKLNWVSELQTSAAATLDKFMDYTYHYGVANLQNYGLLNDPALSAALTPATKTAGGATWITSGGAINASANEVYADIQALVNKLLTQSQGRIKVTDKFTLAMASISSNALTITNQYGITVADMLKKTYPGMEVKVSARYATVSGNVVQLIATQFGGKDTGYCSFTEKMRDHAPMRQLSSFQQKKSAGTWGAIIRYPVAIAQMLGV